MIDCNRRGVRVTRTRTGAIVDLLLLGTITFLATISGKRHEWFWMGFLIVLACGFVFMIMDTWPLRSEKTKDGSEKTKDETS